MTEEEIAKAITDSMGPVFDGMKNLLNTEPPKPQKTDNEKISDMITESTKKMIADRKEREEAQVRKNLITWGGRQ